MEHGDDLTDDFHHIQTQMKFTFVRFIGSFGIPTGSSSHLDKLAKKVEELVEKEFERQTLLEKSGPINNYIQFLISKNISEKYVHIASYPYPYLRF